MSQVKRMVGAASRNRAGRIHAIIKQGFLRELRTRAPTVSLSDLAEAAGIPVIRVSEIERGRGKPPTAGEAGAIAHVLYGQWEIEGVCRICGCTDEWGCDGGCSWADPQHTICSECAKESRP